jgi:predicted transcriptional regulator
MIPEKGKTISYIKEKRQVPQEIRDNLKTFNTIKKNITGALKEMEKATIPELAEKLDMRSSEIVYYLMSMLKYGDIETVGLDDMDEYYIYKLKDNGKN